MKKPPGTRSIPSGPPLKCGADVPASEALEALEIGRAVAAPSMTGREGSAPEVKTLAAVLVESAEVAATSRRPQFGAQTSRTGIIPAIRNSLEDTDLRRRVSGAELPRMAGSIEMDGSAPVGSSLRVMIVDDDILVRRALERTILRNLNAQVDHFGDAREAIGRFAESAFDAVLLDVQMPGMSGPDLAKELRAVEGALVGTREAVRIIFVTADVDFLSAKERTVLEPVFVIHKPWDREALLELLRTARRIG